MDNPAFEEAPLPYAEVAVPLLRLIYDSLEIIYSDRFEAVSEEKTIHKLIERSRSLREESWARQSVRNNPHLLEGIPRADKSDPSELHVEEKIPRVSRLCLEAYGHVNRGRGDTAIFVPSPLSIMVDALTVPSRPESSAYGFGLARAMLFSHFRTHPPSLELPAGWNSLNISEVQEALETFRTSFRHRDNVDSAKSKQTAFVVAHFLAMIGVFVIRFGTAARQTRSDKEAQIECLSFLRDRTLLKAEPEYEANYEFRITPGLSDMPDTQELLNALIGIPLPLSGWPTVFFGGLQRSHQNSLVMSISGPPGTGKTSVALALAAALAPFGTRCLYCSFEEDAETLKRRALGLLPQYFRRTTLPNTDGIPWLFPVALDPINVKSLKVFTTDYLSVITRKLHRDVGISSNSLPGIAPLLVVIDSLTTLFGQSDSPARLADVCEALSELRALNCVVLMLSADAIPRNSRLEYLVDTVISLKHEGTQSAQTKPFRLFQLTKTRLQMSRPGSHPLHLSGEAGVRFSPQLTSQLDSQEIHKTPLADRSQWIDTLRPEIPNRREDRLVDLYPRSRILIHGHGSSGKAPLALKLLIARTLYVRTGEAVPASGYKRTRILVISFLYPKEYYDRALRKLLRSGSREESTSHSPELQTIALTPSFIGPEDFIGRVLHEMDKGHLEGWPYTGVLLDGLHNTFLQFPSLQGKDSMVWPTLYSLLSRHELTIVSTFTTFAKTHKQSHIHSKDDDELILKGQIPFLHVLVQGTDFYLQVEPPRKPRPTRVFIVSVESALNQKIRSRGLEWNADNYRFGDFEEIDPSDQVQLKFPDFV